MVEAPAVVVVRAYDDDDARRRGGGGARVRGRVYERRRGNLAVLKYTTCVMGLTPSPSDDDDTGTQPRRQPHPCTQRPQLTQSCTSACIVSFLLHSRAVKMVKGTKVASIRGHPALHAHPNCQMAMSPCIHSSNFASNRGRLWFLAETCWSLEGF